MIKKCQVDLKGRSPEEMSYKLVFDLQDIDITWCSDGTAVISVEGKTDQDIENCIAKHGLELQTTCRTDIKHRINVQNGKEPIHEILERLLSGRIKKTNIVD